MKERFKAVDGFPDIEVGDHGTVRKSDGFIYARCRSISLRLNGVKRVYSVNRLMWEAFIGPIENGEIIVFKDVESKDLRMDNLDKIKRPQFNRSFNGMHGRVGISARGDGHYVVKREGKYIGIAPSSEDAIEMWEKNESKKERRIREYNDKYKKQ